MYRFLKFVLGMKLYVFRTDPLSIIRSFLPYTQQWFMSYGFADSLWAGSGRNWSCLQAVGKSLWHIPLLCVQRKTPDDGQRNCLKHVEFHSENKFEKSVHQVGFFFYKKFITKHGHVDVKFDWCLGLSSIWWQYTELPVHEMCVEKKIWLRHIQRWHLAFASICMNWGNPSRTWIIITGLQVESKTGVVHTSPLCTLNKNSFSAALKNLY